MNDKIADTDLFSQKLSEVLESMAFMATEDFSGEDPEAELGDCLKAQISFDGPDCGTVTLACQLPLCEAIAANMLGTEEEDNSETVVADALKEVLNMACGQYITARYGTGPVFNLSVPEVERIDCLEWLEISDQPNTRKCLAEDWQMLFALTVEEAR